MKYADAGVNIAVADDAKQRIRHHASRTFTPGVLGGIGGFGALFALDIKKWKEPVLVSSADGVGTKLKIAMATGRALHRRRRPGQSLHQRHSRARRRAAFLSRLSRYGQARARTLSSSLSRV